MAFSINNFRANLTGQGARPNLFEITVPFPTAVSTGEAGQKFTFMCKTAQFPGSDLAMVEVPYFGRKIKLAGNRTFAEWTTTIINDEDFAVHAGLTNWMNGINSHAGNERIFAGTDYQVDALITQYAKNGEKAKEVTIINAWPSTVAPIALGWDTNDAIEEYDVTWQYDYWQATDGVHLTS
jgi:hypothetical protein